MAKFKVQFMTLTQPFKQVRTESFQSSVEALTAVKAYAESAGYSNVKLIPEGSGEEFRFTATTPNNRRGRNVAYGSWDNGNETQSDQF